MRSNEDKTAAVNAIGKLMSTPEFAVFKRECLNIKDAIGSGMYREKGEDLAKAAGILHGIDMALDIINLVKPKQ